jgi:hypothetical protein
MALFSISSGVFGLAHSNRLLSISGETAGMKEFLHKNSLHEAADYACHPPLFGRYDHQSRAKSADYEFTEEMLR